MFTVNLPIKRQRQRRTGGATIAGILPALVVSSASLGDSVIWTFDEITYGADVEVVFPDPVPPDAGRYYADYEITGAWAKVFLVGWIDVLDQIPYDLRYGETIARGPAPVTLFEMNLVFPDPPAVPMVAGDMVMGIDGAGSGYAEVTGIGLNPPIQAVRLAGQIAVTATCLADLNGDQVVDVQDLLELLANWGPCPDPCPPYCHCDLNEDCTVDVLDLLILLSEWGSCP